MDQDIVLLLRSFEEATHYSFTKDVSLNGLHHFSSGIERVIIYCRKIECDIKSKNFKHIMVQWTTCCGTGATVNRTGHAYLITAIR